MVVVRRRRHIASTTSLAHQTLGANNNTRDNAETASREPQKCHVHHFRPPLQTQKAMSMINRPASKKAMLSAPSSPARACNTPRLSHATFMPRILHSPAPYRPQPPDATTPTRRNASNHFQNLNSDSQSTFPIGGYSLPSLVTFGSQVHHSSLGTLSRTPGTWLPQPHQVVFWQVSQWAFLHIF